MGLVLPQTVKMKVSSKYIKYYENLGYDIPKRPRFDKRDIKRYGKDWAYALGEEFEINVLDLSENSKYKVYVTCDECGKTKYIGYNTYVKCQREGKYYCHNCASKLFNSGKNSVRWNSELSYEDRQNMHNRGLNPQNNVFLKAVRKRDNNKCIVCGEEANVVHHLNSWNAFPDERFDTENGCCMCNRCHKSYHLVYGYGNNTKSQFYEWLGYVHTFENVNDYMKEAVKFYCIEDNEIYTVRQFMYKYNINNSSNIYNVLNKKKLFNKKTGNYYQPRSIYGKHILYLDEYNNMTTKDIEKYIEESNNITHIRSKEVLCITTGKDFLSPTHVIRNEDIGLKSCVTISLCCKGKLKHTGRLSNGIQLEWMYLDDFNNLSNEEQLNLIEQNLQTLEEGSFLMQRYRELQDNAQVLNVS